LTSVAVKARPPVMRAISASVLGSGGTRRPPLMVPFAVPSATV
jgi:hypothetical protein